MFESLEGLLHDMVGLPKKLGQVCGCVGCSMSVCVCEGGGACWVLLYVCREGGMLGAVCGWVGDCARGPAGGQAHCARSLLCSLACLLAPV